jgi:hypothetical protein
MLELHQQRLRCCMWHVWCGHRLPCCCNISCRIGVCCTSGDVCQAKEQVYGVPLSKRLLVTVPATCAWLGARYSFADCTIVRSAVQLAWHYGGARLNACSDHCCPSSCLTSKQICCCHSCCLLTLFVLLQWRTVYAAGGNKNSVASMTETMHKGMTSEVEAAAHGNTHALSCGRVQVPPIVCRLLKQMPLRVLTRYSSYSAN